LLSPPVRRIAREHARPQEVPLPAQTLRSTARSGGRAQRLPISQYETTTPVRSAGYAEGRKTGGAEPQGKEWPFQ
jgi:hypothetical protein